MNFTYHEKSGTHTGYCIVKSCERKLNKNGEPYLDMVLSDRSGEINAKLWKYDENLHGFYEPNSLIKVQGTITKFNDADQLRVDRIRKVNETDDVKIEDYVSSAVYTGETMFNELISIANDFGDKDISTLVTTILSENKEKLLYYPAAFKLHHAMRSGLLQHTLSIVRLAQSVCKIYPFVDSDLLLGGAMLHDVAKLEELVSNETGIASGYSTEGTLIGHLVKGAMLIDKTAERIGVPHEKAVLLEHMIISHHGDPEFGAAVRPLFIEADILAALDRLDARIVEVNNAVSGVEAGGFSTRQWALDNRAFYNHGRVDVTKETKLF